MKMVSQKLSCTAHDQCPVGYFCGVGGQCLNLEYAVKAAEITPVIECKTHDDCPETTSLCSFDGKCLEFKMIPQVSPPAVEQPAAEEAQQSPVMIPMPPMHTMPTNCNGEVVDILHDRNNCGGCGRKCPDDTSDALWDCINGMCVDPPRRDEHHHGGGVPGFLGGLVGGLLNPWWPYPPYPPYPPYYPPYPWGWPPHHRR